MQVVRALRPHWTAQVGWGCPGAYLAMQTSAVYLWATYDKLTLPFLSGVRLQHLFLQRYGTSDPVTMPGFETI